MRGCAGAQGRNQEQVEQGANKYRHTASSIAGPWLSRIRPDATRFGLPGQRSIRQHPSLPLRPCGGEYLLDQGLRIVLNPAEVGLPLKALGIEFIHILGAAWASRKPSVGGGDLESSNGGVIARRIGQHGGNRLPRVHGVGLVGGRISGARLFVLCSPGHRSAHRSVRPVKRSIRDTAQTGSFR